MAPPAGLDQVVLRLNICNIFLCIFSCTGYKDVTNTCISPALKIRRASYENVQKQLDICFIQKGYTVCGEVEDLGERA